MAKNIFAEKIIAWYHEHKRSLPWRTTNDPYKIWLSEIILQQTRVAQGIPYYLKFIERFPDVHQLAAAKEDEVLRLWQGLGYYTRARNLFQCAKVVSKQYGGHFPNHFAELLTLPGIGHYTAAAIASIAFKEPVPVVDGNVYRVLARIFGIENDISEPASRNYYFEKAGELISKEHPDDFNQAMMEFGATHCLPDNPKCESCIFKRTCFAYQYDLQNQLPVKTKKVKSRKRYLFYLVIVQNEKLAMRQRTGKDIWKGLFDFYAIESDRPRTLDSIMTDPGINGKFFRTKDFGVPSAEYKHVLTHQVLHVKFVTITLKAEKTNVLPFPSEELKFYSAKKINELPKPVLISKYLSDIGFL